MSRTTSEERRCAFALRRFGRSDRDALGRYGVSAFQQSAEEIVDDAEEDSRRRNTDA